MHELQFGNLGLELIARELLSLQTEACDRISDSRESVHVASAREIRALGTRIYTARYHSHLIDELVWYSPRAQFSGLNYREAHHAPPTRGRSLPSSPTIFPPLLALQQV